MSSITVRPLRPEDREAFLSLLESRDDLKIGEAEKRLELLWWLAFSNPRAGSEPTYFVAEDQGRIVAHKGRMPIDFVIGGRRRKGYYVHDLFVHPEYRKKGLGFVLTARLAEAVEKNSDSFFCLLGGTPLNRTMQRRMGYTEIPPAGVYVKSLNLLPQLQRRLKVPLLVRLGSSLSSVCFAVADLFRLRGRAPHVRTFDRFNGQFDEFLASVNSVTGICSFKDSAYLNWKFIDRPYRRDTILGYVDDTKAVRGFVLVGFSPYKGDIPVGIILDIMADPHESRVVEELLMASVQHFRSLGASQIQAVLSDERYIRIFRRFMFRKGYGDKSILLGNLEKVSEIRENLLQTENWHITVGESDSYMLAP